MANYKDFSYHEQEQMTSFQVRPSPLLQTQKLLVASYETIQEVSLLYKTTITIKGTIRCFPKVWSIEQVCLENLDPAF